MNRLTALWNWYRHIGEPVEFYTNLPRKACMERLDEMTIGWDNRNVFGMKPYKAQILFDGRFKIKSRRVPTYPPFAGTFEDASDGGTWVRGQFLYDTSFVNFVAIVGVAAPVLGAIYYNRVGLIVGLTIALLFVMAALYARAAENNTKPMRELKAWLMETLESKPIMLEGTPKKPVR